MEMFGKPVRRFEHHDSPDDKEYTFEVTLKTTITVRAKDEREARQIAANEFLSEDHVHIDIVLKD